MGQWIRAIQYGIGEVTTTKPYEIWYSAAILTFETIVENEMVKTMEFKIFSFIKFGFYDIL